MCLLFLFLHNTLWNDLTISWSELTIPCNEVTWNELTMERNDRIPLIYRRPDARANSPRVVAPKYRFTLWPQPDDSFQGLSPKLFQLPIDRLW